MVGWLVGWIVGGDLDHQSERDNSDIGARVGTCFIFGVL